MTPINGEFIILRCKLQYNKQRILTYYESLHNTVGHNKVRYLMVTE